ncbi:hypothetical protein [Nocardia stercoris]|uniref:ESX-1 secretion-associated protein n=1 Tax=Nocardia stercoris TaxID=2483361 RepID=A0A3M2KWB8_9NOCA|nr:hypothetical protein [Nocardia stercoris]RMI29897.1 hypothetical protein EBN03_24195 [Nocardia stercoris]
MLQADLDQLSKLADTLTDVGKSIGEMQIHAFSDQVADALPGCLVGPACKQAGNSTEQAWKNIAERINKLAKLVKDSSTNYQISDDDFATKLQAFNFRPEGAN